MKTTKKELATKIHDICASIVAMKDGKSSYNEYFTEKAFELKTKYDIPLSLASDILSLKANCEDQSEFVLFCMLDVMAPGMVEEYFVEKEIKLYTKTKFKVNKLKFPYSIPMIQITDSQWIGRFSVKEFIKLRDAQLIFYNENTQRPLIKKASGVDSYDIYIPDVDRKEVEAIMESYRTESYIPNTITLNMPEDADFEYADGQLIIKSIPNFDITDGYHRYIAMSNMYNLDKNFDYPMELRITQFEEEHAMHFIWQEDQKHKMTKAASEGLNQQLYGNQVVNRLKKSNVFKNAINRNNGIIDATLMGQMIELLYFHKKKVSNSDVINAYKDILSKFDDLLFENPYLLDKKWTMRYTIVMMYCVSNNILQDFDKFYKIIESEYKDYFSTNCVEIKHISKLDKIYKGGDLNV